MIKWGELKRDQVPSYFCQLSWGEVATHEKLAKGIQVLAFRIINLAKKNENIITKRALIRVFCVFSCKRHPTVLPVLC